MNNKKELQKEYAIKQKEQALKQKESDKLQKELVMIKLCEKLQCVTDAVQRSEFLSGKIISMPGDELRIVMNEVINSPEFISLFERTLESSTRLAALRRNKAVKAEKRKRMREQSAPSPDAESVSEII